IDTEVEYAQSSCRPTLRVTGRRSAQRGGNPPASEAPLVGGPVHAVVGRQPPKLTRGYAHKRYTGPRWFAATRPRRRAPHSVEAKRYRPNVWRTGSALGESTRSGKMHQPLVTCHVDRLMRGMGIDTEVEYAQSSCRPTMWFSGRSRRAKCAGDCPLQLLVRFQVHTAPLSSMMIFR